MLQIETQLLIKDQEDKEREARAIAAAEQGVYALLVLLQSINPYTHFPLPPAHHRQ
jgi:hypothetical protein